MDGDREVELGPDGQVVSWFGDLDSFGETDFSCGISGFEVELDKERSTCGL